MTAEETRNMERLVDWRLERWRGRTDYDDLRQEALIGAWKAVERTRGGKFEFSTIVVKAADYAAREWMRGTRSDLPHYGRRYAQAPEMISLQQLQANRNAFGVMDDRNGSYEVDPEEPDFAPALLDRLENRAAYVQALGTATPTQAAALRALYRQGKTQQQLAEETDRNFSAISQLHARALKRCRAAMTEEER